MTNLINKILCGDSRLILQRLPDKSVDCCVTSPPYFNLRNYENTAGQIGQESTPEEYLANLLVVFSEVHRALKDNGTLWVNIGDTYAGSGKGCSGNDY